MQLRNGLVLTCHAEACSYNCSGECCAPAISVGDEHPVCDMFTTGSVKRSTHAGTVTRCHIDECHFNSRMLCHASGITVSSHEGHADCATYRH